MEGTDRRLWKAMGSPETFPKYESINMYAFNTVADHREGNGTLIRSSRMVKRDFTNILDHAAIIGFEFVGGDWGNGSHLSS